MWWSRSAVAAAPAARVGAEWVIEPARAGGSAAVRELWQYRRLLLFFGRQSIKGLYEGTTLGIFWLFARPLLPVIIGSFVFGALLNIPSNGLPYFLFYLTGMAIWTLFDRSLLWSTKSLDDQRSIIKRLYFPRLLVPIASVSPALVYFGIYMTLIVGAGAYYLAKDGRWYLAIGPGWLTALAAALMSIVLALTVGLFTSVLQVRHKEVRFGLRYALSFWFYLTPVIYPMSEVPANLQWVIYLNPMAALVETFKWALLGSGQFPAVPLVSSFVIMLVIGAVGLAYFHRSEATSVDDL